MYKKKIKFEQRNALNGHFFVSFVTQKREIIREETQRALKPVGGFAYFVHTK